MCFSLLRGQRVEGMECLFCDQGVNNCGYSNRRAKTFELQMQEGFRQGVAVPCFFKENLKSICGNWLHAKCLNDYTYHMYLYKTEKKIKVAGPYWRSVIRVYDIQIGDVVSFTYVGEDEDFDKDRDEDFDLTVYQIGENGKEVKFPVTLTVVNAMPQKVTEAAENMLFSDIRDLCEDAMNEINFGISKAILAHLVMDIDNGSFYDYVHDLQFCVHTMSNDEIDFDYLHVPAKSVEGYKCPTQGNALFWRQGMQEAIEGSYTIRRAHILLNEGWAGFRAAANIQAGSILLVKVEARAEAIGLDFVEVY